MILVLSAVLLTGFGSKNIKLINAKDPFIDLDGTVGNSILNAGTATDDEEPVSPVEPTPEPQPTETPEPSENKVEEIVVMVSGEVFFIDELSVSNMESLRKALEDGLFSDKLVILTDDYAETMTFKRLQREFKKQGISVEERRYADE